MKVLLVNPPVEDFYFTPQRAYPLGLLYLAASLSSGGFKVKILNCPGQNKKITLKIPPKFQYLARYYKPNKSPFCLFSNYYHFGLTFEEIEQAIREFNPQIVGISSNFSPYHGSARMVAKIVKNIDKRIITIIGGRVATALPEFVLKNKEIDFAIRGEAEESLLKLCRNLSKGKSGIMPGLCFKVKDKYRISKEIPIIANLDSLNFPQRTLIDSSCHKFKSLTSAALISSRGCSFSCGFCAINEKFRIRSAENVFREISECYKNGIRHFDFEDDNINLNPEFEKIIDLLIDNLPGKVKISFMNGLLTKGINEKLLEKLSCAGLTHIDLSIISTSNQLRKKASRKEKGADIFSLSTLTAKKNIPLTVHFIVALPHQTIKLSLSDLIELAGKRVYLGPSIFYPVVESSFFNYLKNYFLITHDDCEFFRSSAAYFDKTMSRDDIFFIFYMSRIINFIKEIIDKFSLKSNSFNAFLKEKTKHLDITASNISCINKIDRDILGLILIRKMFKEGNVFRVQEKIFGGEVSYNFFPEEFINKNQLKEMLEKLIISGVSSDSCIETKLLMEKE